jgi:hypothetical protein
LYTHTHTRNFPSPFLFPLEPIQIKKPIFGDGNFIFLGLQLCLTADMQNRCKKETMTNGHTKKRKCYIFLNSKQVDFQRHLLECSQAVEKVYGYFSVGNLLANILIPPLLYFKRSVYDKSKSFEKEKKK